MFNAALSSVVSVLLLGSIAEGKAASDDGNASKLPVLQTVRQIRALSKTEANRHYPVKIRGVVTYYFRTHSLVLNPAKEFTSDMFVQDATGGNWINLGPNSPDAEVGQLIEVSGVTGQTDFAPDIQNPSWKVVGHAAFPTPDKPLFDQLASTAEDCRWVEVEGIVRSVHPLIGGQTLELAMSGGHVEVFVPYSVGTLSPKSIDSRLRIQGVAGASFNERSQLRGVLLFVPRVQDIQVLEPSRDDPFAIPPSPVSDLLRYTISGGRGHRVKVAGIVTLQSPGNYLYIRAADDSILVETSQVGRFRAGDRVEAIGFPTVGNFSPYLQQSTVKLIQHGSPAPAQVASLTELQSGSLDGELVQIDATLLDRIATSSNHSLIVKVGQYVTSAEFVVPPSNSALAAMQPGARVRLIGISSVAVDEHEFINFQFLLQSINAVQILEQPSWWNRQHILWLLSLSAGVTVAIAAWLLVMRLRVREQTEVIRRKLESEASLERRYRSLFERNLAGVYQLQLDFGMQDCNDACARILGFSDRAALLRENQRSTGGLRSALSKLLASRDKTTASEVEIECASGARIWVVLSAHRVDDFSGAVVEGTIVDITDLRKTAEELAQRTNFLNGLLESNPLAIAVISSEMKVFLCNPALEELFGYSCDELMGKDLAQIIIPADRKHESVQAFEKLRRGITSSFVSRRLRKDGTLVDVFTRLVPLKSEGEMEAFFAIYEDISARLATESELRATKEAAEAANQAKSEFLANMSHEIRTPLNGVLLAAELAAAETTDPHQAEYIDTIRESGTSLLMLLNDLLDFSKIEAGHMALESHEFSIRECLSECIRLSEFRARQKGLVLECSVEEDVPELAIGDSFRLRQILLNLIGNGTKFTEKGSVSVHVRCVAHSSERVRCHFAVEDTGIGIPKEKQDLLFKKFEQADASTTRRFGGTGLGLAISKELVQLMNGRMWVQSEPGRGSSFQFEVEFACPPAWHEVTLHGPNEKTTSLQAGDCPSLRVLLAEDNAVNRRLAIRLLEKQGHTVVAVEDGMRAVEAAAADKFDLILMDLHMPEMDGAEATRRIRTTEVYANRTRVPIIAMTASAMLADQEACRKAGMNGFLSKPIDIDQMIALLQSLTVAHLGDNLLVATLDRRRSLDEVTQRD